ncbi:MAG: choloylglycine hydrolase [Oscillospiraceae bacterium]|nr:choloylglycine hydrolase [Oscillospiraceae bacterium]
MCTAVTFQTKAHYFGRNLDLEYHYQEAVTITPRNFPFHFRNANLLNKHYALVGIATVSENYPLYYDATNETGLSMAALNFPGNAIYQSVRDDKDNIAPFEFIPWILGQCANVDEALAKLNQLNLANIPFSKEYPLSPLHWILADRKRAITIEPLESGLKIYDNPVGVLTNNPTFDYHIHNLKNYLNLSRDEPENRFAPQLTLKPFSRGMGAFGLPGDLSSPSRFIRAAFTKFNSVCGESESESISQFFHILGAVAQQNGCVRVGEKFEKTVYSSCCNTDLGIYYYRTYENSQITAVDMHSEELNGSSIISYPLIISQQINNLNK